MKCIATVVLIFALATSTAAVQAASGDQLYAHAGRLVNAGQTKLNFYCTGSGSPTVVFDAGWEDWSPSWATIQPVISRRTRTCTYDRVGSGFSEAGPMPRTSVEIAKELHAALHSAGIPGPYLLVGHSFGGYNIRALPISTCRKSTAKCSWTSRMMMSRRQNCAPRTTASGPSTARA